ncbi:hypothetical protein GALMADRAFT_268010 [Galerina marginata CBS 339.88]|uniref:Uncharacterized protein n=1 Tax=Galerina marginata (strain CBS 339.88) TaxID=685588 RepID=A0A067T8Y7_GALM3|nr:hypothetical protein GALMADRAFT_268010 [Galerina marginata CBS 339.88]
MIPRFSNPHFLPRLTKTVTRAEIYADDDEDAKNDLIPDPDLFRQLNELLAETIRPVQPHDVEDPHSRSTKRRRIEVDDQASSSHEDTVLFRLVSSTLPPLPVSILPPPPPPPITREPDAEDNEQQTLLRRQRAEVASVDATDLLRESTGILQSPGTSSKPRNVFAKLEHPLPNMMIVRTLQNFRKTRPPVTPSALAQFPYISDISTMRLDSVKSRAMDCPVIDAVDDVTDPSPTQKRRRRKRRSILQRSDQPLPQFWRPNPSLAGKCRGYAYGYPSSLEPRQNHPRRRYNRDSMKKAVYPSNM